MKLETQIDSMLVTLTQAKEKVTQAKALRERVEFVWSANYQPNPNFEHALDLGITQQAMKAGFLSMSCDLEEKARALVGAMLVHYALEAEKGQEEPVDRVLALDPA